MSFILNLSRNWPSTYWNSELILGISWKIQEDRIVARCLPLTLGDTGKQGRTYNFSEAGLEFALISRFKQSKPAGALQDSTTVIGLFQARALFLYHSALFNQRNGCRSSYCFYMIGLSVSPVIPFGRLSSNSLTYCVSWNISCGLCNKILIFFPYNLNSRLSITRT